MNILKKYYPILLLLVIVVSGIINFSLSYELTFQKNKQKPIAQTKELLPTKTSEVDAIPEPLNYPNVDMQNPPYWLGSGNSKTKANFSGKWRWEIEGTAAGEKITPGKPWGGSLEITLSQNGDKLTGEYNSVQMGGNRLGKGAIKGIVQGNIAFINYENDFGIGSASLIYTPGYIVWKIEREDSNERTLLPYQVALEKIL